MKLRWKTIFSWHDSICLVVRKTFITIDSYNRYLINYSNENECELRLLVQLEFSVLQNKLALALHNCRNKKRIL